jgi:hypothetical protein
MLLGCETLAKKTKFSKGLLQKDAYILLQRYLLKSFLLGKERE